jgi:D-serine deaminase-like pyridoxal phosphate-dependent protein
MQSRGDIPTPALLLDLDAFEDNVQKMAAHLKARGKAFRPHGKTHKCPEVARALIRAGAVGLLRRAVERSEVFAQSASPGC